MKGISQLAAVGCVACVGAHTKLPLLVRAPTRRATLGTAGFVEVRVAVAHHLLLPLGHATPCQLLAFGCEGHLQFIQVHASIPARLVQWQPRTLEQRR